MVTEYSLILNKLKNLKIERYSSTRNFIDGQVTMLSPYISRGILSTNQILKHLISQGISLKRNEKFIQELAWRDYWQLVWIEKNIDKDLKHNQADVLNFGISENILNASTGIKAIDKSIELLYDTGYMHNHLRMYLASLCTNVGKSHWKVPSKWMYYHLLDGDWGSNALSWQWVAGSNSNKKYIANQDNINKYTKSNQRNTILDISYELLSTIKQPEKLSDLSKKVFKTKLPKSNNFKFIEGKDACIYNYYNLDPKWKNEVDLQRILLIEPSIFIKYPISTKSMNFMLDLAKNINEIKIFVGEFDELPIKNEMVYFKEHPLNRNYNGLEEPRDWLSSVKGYYPSFFSYWNKAKKEIYKKNA